MADRPLMDEASGELARICMKVLRFIVRPRAQGGVPRPGRDAGISELTLHLREDRVEPAGFRWDGKAAAGPTNEESTPAGLAKDGLHSRMVQHRNSLL